MVQLGLALLARRPALAPRDAADVHGWIALAAHNRQFLTQGDLPLARFLSDHLERALAAEDRPAHRAALLYRLAVARGRRMKDADAALAWAGEAVAASRHPALPFGDAAYQEAWAFNIRAYLEMQGKDLDGARRSTVAGFARIDQLFARLDELAADGTLDAMGVLDLRATHSLLAFNTRTLLALLDRGSVDVAEWLERSRVAIRAVPGIERFEAFAWTELYAETNRPDLALPLVLKGIDDARREVDAMREYEHAVTAVELAYRLGETAAARAQAARVQEIRRRCGLPPLPAVEVLAALACLRGGAAAEAGRRLGEALADPAHAEADARAPLLGLRAWAAAVEGDAAAADADLDEAIELAVASGERDTLLRVAVAAGRAAAALGREDEALEAFEQALEIAGVAAEGAAGAPPPPAAERIAALVAAGGGQPERLAEALRLAAGALGDADVWWELGPLLAAWERPQDGLPAADEATAAAHARVAAAAAVRPRPSH